jgi:UDPglucose 6-dehydrogenase
MPKRVSVVGLGKLGASMAAGIASRGIEVIGVDVNHAAVDAVNAGHAPVQETGLEEMVAANRPRLRATLNHAEAIRESELTFVIVPTPSDERGAFSLQYVAYAFREIGRALAQKTGYHTVVLTSTVLPGATRHGLIPILERFSGKRCGEGFGFCYSPEFVALGSVIRDFLNPDFLLIGEYDRGSGDRLEACYREVMAHAPAVARMSLENAELAKISVNAFVTTKITFANMLADICGRMPGGDVDAVSNAIGLDSRIGRKYLTGGLGYGGPCFPRDNMALAFFASAVGARADLPVTTDKLNRAVASRAIDYVSALADPESTIAVLGLSYKPASHVVEESQAIQLVKALVDRHYRVVAYDPLAGREANQELGGRALVLDSIAACLQGADLVLIANADPEFKRLTPADFTDGRREVIVVDFWRVLAPTLSGAPGIRYIPYGCGTELAGAVSNRLSELWAGTAASHVEGV